MTATGRTSGGDLGEATADVAFTSSPVVDAAASSGVTPLTQFVASVEPSVMFASLAAQCVPELCDDCAIDIVDGTDARYSIVYPPRTTATEGRLRIAVRAGAARDHSVRVPFSYPRSASQTSDDQHRADRVCDAFRGVAVFGWHRRVPTRSDRTAAAVLVDRAVHTIAWQRSERAVEVATRDAANLQQALQHSRRLGAAIGILMTLHKITEDEAFELLARASQRSHRKVREVAADVIHTGWLDPALITAATRHRVRSTTLGEQQMGDPSS